MDANKTYTRTVAGIGKGPYTVVRGTAGSWGESASNVVDADGEHVCVCYTHVGESKTDFHGCFAGKYSYERACFIADALNAMVFWSWFRRLVSVVWRCVRQRRTIRFDWASSADRGVRQEADEW